MKTSQQVINKIKSIYDNIDDTSKMTYSTFRLVKYLLWVIGQWPDFIEKKIKQEKFEDNLENN